jgi:lipopolysaccharide export system protein LptA
MKNFAIRFAVPLLALALLLSQPCRADDGDKDKPINFTSDTGGASSATGNGELSGHVTITQGTLVLHADRITFKQNPDNSLSATAFGSPVSFRQRRQGSDEYDEAYAQRIVYDGQKQLVELFDRALLKQGPTKELRSDYISYNRASGVASAGAPAGTSTPDKPASRVTGVILPKDINAVDKPKDDKAGDAKGGGTKPDAGKPDAGKADAAKSDAAKPDATKPPPPAPLPLTIDNELKTK